MRLNRSLGWVLSVASLAVLGSAVGCTVLAHVDRDQIPEDNGSAGSGGAGGKTDGGGGSGGTAGSGGSAGAGGDASVDGNDGQAGGGGGLDASDEDGGQAGAGGAGGLDASDEDAGQGGADAADEDAGTQVDAADEDAGAQVDAADEDAGAQVDAADEDAGAQVDAADEDAGTQVDAADEDAGTQVDAADEDAGACNNLTNGAPVVQATVVGDVAPTLAGGAVLPGTYFLTSAEVFDGSDSGASQPTGNLTQYTLELNAGNPVTANLVAGVGDTDAGIGTEIRATYEVALDLNAHTVSFSPVCGPTLVSTSPYEVDLVDGGQSVIKLLVTGNTLLTFTKQ